MEVMKVFQILNEVAKKCNLTEPQCELDPSFQINHGITADILSAKITDRTDGKVVKIILKIAPNDTSYREQLFVRDVYLNEIYFYEQVIPLLATDSVRVFPKCFVTRSEVGEELLALENLQAANFETVNRAGVDVGFVLNEFAKFHALSFALKARNSEKFYEIANGIYNNLEEFNRSTKLTQCIAEQCETVEGIFAEGSVELEKLRKFRKFKLFEVMDSHAVQEVGFSVVIHGDAYLNNIFIKRENGKPTELRFIDFQAARIGSVVQDLSYFIYTSCSKFDFDKLDEHLEAYHATLLRTYEQLGCDPKTLPSFAQLQEEWKTFCTYGLAMTIVVLHGQSSDPDEFPNFHQVIKSGGNLFESLNFVSRNEDVYHKRLKDVIAHFVERDFI